MRLPSLDSGRLFSAKIAFRNNPCATLQSGRFCGTFFAAPAQPFMAAQVFVRSRPAKGCAPFDPRQGSPCTCPSPPFVAAQGLCFSRNFAVEIPADRRFARIIGLRDRKKTECCLSEQSDIPPQPYAKSGLCKAIGFATAPFFIHFLRTIIVRQLEKPCPGIYICS